MSEKKIGRKILIFHDENPFSKFEIEKKLTKFWKFSELFLKFQNFHFLNWFFEEFFSENFWSRKKNSATFFFEKKIFGKSIFKMKISKFRKKVREIFEILSTFFRSKFFSTKNISIENCLICISIPNFPKIPKIILRKIFNQRDG